MDAMTEAPHSSVLRQALNWCAAKGAVLTWSRPDRGPTDLHRACFVFVREGRDDGGLGIAPWNGEGSPGWPFLEAVTLAREELGDD